MNWWIGGFTFRSLNSRGSFELDFSTNFNVRVTTLPQLTAEMLKIQ